MNARGLQVGEDMEDLHGDARVWLMLRRSGGEKCILEKAKGEKDWECH